MKKITLTIQPSEQESRIDKVISQNLNRFSRSKIQNMIEKSLITFDGTQIKSNQKFPAGASIEILLPEEDNFTLNAEDIPIHIAYEDDFLLVVNKPSGMVVHPASGNWSGTLVNALLGLDVPLSGDSENIKPGIVHRLDKQTSGLLIVAKNDRIHAAMAALFSERKIEKQYIALVWGDPEWEETTVEQAIARDGKDRKKFNVSSAGKNSITKFRVEKRLGHLTLIHAFPKTGRTHQIRVHLKYLNLPIFGDETYNGGKKHCNCLIQPAQNDYRKMMQDNKIALHASRLIFTHPETEEKMEINAPLPDYFEHWIAKSEEIYCA